MTSHRRILHIVEASFAGVGRHVLDLAQEQAERGHEVHVAYSSLRESGPFVSERLAKPEVTFHRIDMAHSLSAADFSAFLRLMRLAVKLKPEVIHGHSTKGGILARTLLRRGALVLYTPNAIYSMNPLLGPRARRVVGSIERLLSLRTDKIIAVSPEEETHLHDLGVSPMRTVVIANGIAPQASAKSSTVRAAMGLPLDDVIFGFVGRFDDQKAPADLVQAFERFLSENRRSGNDLTDGSRLHLALVGDGPLRGDVERQVSGLNARAQIHLLGQQPGRWAIDAFDVFVLPSRYEGFPYVLLEAAQAGVPIITTVEACASQLIDSPQGGLIVSAGDTEALARAMATMLNSDERRRMGDAVRQAAAVFTVHAMADGVDELFDQQ